MTDKRDEDERASALASQRYHDYKNGWLSGSNGKPLGPYDKGRAKPLHPDWHRRGFADGKHAFREAVRRIAKDLELPITTTEPASNEEPWFDGWATAVGGEHGKA